MLRRFSSASHRWCRVGRADTPGRLRDLPMTARRGRGPTPPQNTRRGQPAASPEGMKLGSDLLDAVEPATGDGAYRRPDGIAVVPAAPLGPQRGGRFARTLWVCQTL